MRGTGTPYVSSRPCFGIAAAAGTSSDQNALQDHERCLLRGKGFKTQYFGPSHGASLLLQFEELSSFVKDILQRIPTLQKTRNLFKQQRREAEQPLILPDFDSLVSLVPEQSRADVVVQEYFGTLETTYRVLHAPTFFRQYKKFWMSAKDSSPAFVVQLLLVCASVNSAVPGGTVGFVGRSSLNRDVSLKWIGVCATWLDLQSQKHVTLEVFQIRVLLMIAQRLNCVKIKREWTVAGQLLRQAMSMGMHREPTCLSKDISVFDQEMRRRLWCTVLELEVQASLDRGMGPSLGPFDWDSLPPLNLHDEDFDESTEKMPPARPMREFTRTSFLCIAHQHLPLRMEILSRINGLRVTVESDTAIELDQKIRQILDSIPTWSNDEAKSVSQGLSELLLYDLLVLIHQPFAIRADAQAQHFYSRVARRHAALSILKTFSDMRLSRALTFTHLRSDLFRASLALCHDIVVSVGSKADLVQDRNAAVKIIEQSVDLMEERIRSLGEGFYQYWITCSALGLVRSKMPPGNAADQIAQEAADRVVRLHGYLISQQIAPVDQPTTNSMEDPAMSTANTLVGMSGQQTPAQIQGQGQTLSEIDPFMSVSDPFNVFSDTLFDFDLGDMWNLGGITQY